VTRRALVIDDESGIRFVLRGVLEDRGFVVDEATTGEEGLEALGRTAYDLAFLDIIMPGIGGMEVLDRVRAAGGETSIIVMTAQDTMRNAVEAMKRGAFDYVTKPFDLAEIEVLVQRAGEIREMRRIIERVKGREREHVTNESMLVGRAPVMQQLFKTIGRVAASDATVMLEGESGTGKELIAQAIHKAGPRAAGPFVPVNSAAIPAELLESELFGHVRGSFTGATENRSGRFEEADGGTLFLDEIAEMPPEIQVKLLRVLESRTLNRVGGDETIQFDVRMIAATNRNPEQAVRDGRLREDLFYRLMVVGIELPPLRDRGDDIRLLAEHFVESLGARYDAAKRVTAAELREQGDYRWPGNVRELRNLVERALALGSDEIVLKAVPGAIASSVAPRETLIVGSTIADVEYRLIVATLSAFQGNKPKAARTLGISLKTLYNRLNAYRVA